MVVVISARYTFLLDISKLKNNVMHPFCLERGKFETKEPLIFGVWKTSILGGWFGSKASCLKTLDASREEELRTTRLTRLDRLNRLDRLDRLNRLDGLNGLDRLSRLDRLNSLNKLNNHMDTKSLQSSVSGPGQLASGGHPADMSQLHAKEDSLAGGDPSPPPPPAQPEDQAHVQSGQERTNQSYQKCHLLCLEHVE